MSTSTASRILPTTVTRIADIDSEATSVLPISRDRWATGDYVVARVRDFSRALRQVELPNGRMADITRGELVMGALGRRAATLEAVGGWQDVTEDGQMHLLTSAGLMGRATSVSPFLPSLVSLEYVGHLHLHSTPARMRDWVVPAPEGATFELPVVLVIGTSMSAGKTESAKVVVAQLRDLGRVVVGAKLTGAARYRDPLAMWDAGATAIYDFVDAGLPSTAVGVDEYVSSIVTVLNRMGSCGADVAVIEAGASPLEEYNGAALAELIGAHIFFTVLCASDPYAVAGLMDAFGTKPDLVAGGAANTTTGVALVSQLSGLTALNLADPHTHIELKERISASLPPMTPLRS